MQNTQAPPFTKEEQEILDLITTAHNKYVSIQPAADNDGLKWANCINGLQEVLIYRFVKREYPNHFK